MSEGSLTDPAKQKRAKERLELERERKEHDLREVMASPAGRRLIWRLVNDVGGVCNGTFTGNALSGAYGEGRRAVGRELMIEAQRVDPDGWVLALQESLAEAKRQAAE